MDLELDTLTHDLVVTKGDLKLISSDTAVRQNIKQRLLTFLGEWFLNTTRGVPYYQYILVKNPNLDLVNATIQNTVLATPGVVELSQFQLDYDPNTRSLSIGMQGKSLTGNFSLNTSVGA